MFAPCPAFCIGKYVALEGIRGGKEITKSEKLLCDSNSLSGAQL